MIKSKKAQFFALYLVILTLFMCFLSIYMYAIQNRAIGESLVSPVRILRFEDERDLFEIQERVLIKEAAKETIDAGKWGDKDYFERKFLNKISERSLDFLFEDANLDGEKIIFGALQDFDSRKNFLEKNKIYDFDFIGNDLKVVRNPIVKKFDLEATGKEEIRFDVGVEIVLQKKYSFPEEEVKE